MRHIILILFLLIASGTLYSQSSEMPYISEDNRGEGSGGGIARSTSFSFSLIEVLVTANTSLDSYFNSDLGIVTVVIRNSVGTEFYREDINTSIIHNTSIDISSLPNDTYSIAYTNSNNELLLRKSFTQNR